MFRRIELIQRLGDEDRKSGLLGVSPNEVIDAWIEDLNIPRRRLYKNCRFYFTEHGWNTIGRRVVGACIHSGTQYRVIAIKERSVDVMYRDEVQVAVRPKDERE